MKLLLGLVLACFYLQEATAAAGTCIPTTARIVIISNNPANIPAQNCVGTCIYFPYSKLATLSSLNLGASDTLIVIDGPCNNPSSHALIQSFAAQANYWASITNVYFFTNPVNSNLNNGNAMMMSQNPHIPSSAHVMDYAAYATANPGIDPCAFVSGHITTSTTTSTTTTSTTTTPPTTTACPVCTPPSCPPTTTGSTTVASTKPGYTFISGLGNYKFVSNAATWSDANIACIADGAHMVIINSEAENTAMQTLFISKEGTIVGASDELSVWLGYYESATTNGVLFAVDGSSVICAGYTPLWFITVGGTSTTPGSLFAMHMETGYLWDFPYTVSATFKLPYICEM